MKFYTVITLTLLLAAGVYADTMNVTLSGNYPADYYFYSYTATDGSAQNGVPVAPYPTFLTDSDGLYSNTSVFSICYDLNNPTFINQAYPGHFVTPTDTATLETTYLANKMNAAGLTSAPAAVKGALALAIWEIMFPSSTKTDGTYFPIDPAAQSYELEAAQAVASGVWTVADSATYPTFIPDDATSQRFGMFLPGVSALTVTAATPEPSTLALIGGSLFLLGWRRRSHYSAARNPCRKA